MNLPETFSTEPDPVDKRLANLRAVGLLLLYTSVAWVILYWAQASYGAEPETGPPTVWVMAECYAVDGDTIRGTLILPFSVDLRDQTIRAATHDTWESTRHRFGDRTTEDELRKGRRATEALSDLLDSGRLYVSPVRPERDAYGRVLAKWMVVLKDGTRVDVGQFMRDGGHCRPEPEPRSELEVPIDTPHPATRRVVCVVDYAVDHRCDVSGRAYQEPAGWQFSIAEVNGASAADSHGWRPDSSKRLDVWPPYFVVHSVPRCRSTATSAECDSLCDAIPMGAGVSSHEIVERVVHMAVGIPGDDCNRSRDAIASSAPESCRRSAAVVVLKSHPSVSPVRETVATGNSTDGPFFYWSATDAQRVTSNDGI